MDKNIISHLYPSLKKNGMLYLVIGTCITSDTPDTKEAWEANLHILLELLEGIPPTETQDIERVQKGIDIVQRELQKFNDPCEGRTKRSQNEKESTDNSANGAGRCEK